MNGRRMAGLVGLMLAGGMLAGCGSGSEAGTAADSAAGVDMADRNAAAPEMPVKAEGGTGGGQPQPQQQQQQEQQKQVSQPGVDRKLVRTASLELAAPDVVDVANKARQIALDRGGFAGQEEVRGDTASITLHVPSDQFDRTVAELSGLVARAEDIRSRTMTTEDVTEQMVDVESRIATQRLSVERVRGLLARAQTVDEIVRIESEVTRREAELESLQKRRETLAGQVALSRVTVKVTKGDPPPPAAEEDRGFLGALAGGWNAFLTTGGVVLEVFGALLPFLVVLGIPGVFAYRWWRRRRVIPAAVPQEAKA
ncbi:MAG TPA: DUF4349 domain-containing protein [Actinophytocola sp.]|uniref:DUF4349 domain-containing protein n=1 Tax=Actinophytocola sp. TaxID=1872138 RepID=UPI002DBD013E|nr:DUF4349 domain-containing protein [Actinophytocola sp.]HEU5469796.1 DUF4349 domain-containing protein [Actinophytocola sp.]